MTSWPTAVAVLCFPCFAFSGSIFEPFVPPEGDGRKSSVTKEVSWKIV